MHQRRRALETGDDWRATVVNRTVVSLLDVTRHGVADGAETGLAAIGLASSAEHGESRLSGILNRLARVAREFVVVVIVGVVRCGAVGPNVTSAQAILVSVQPRGQDVDEAEEDSHDTTGHTQSPKGQGHAFWAVATVTKLPQSVAAHDHHGDAEPCESGLVTDGRPVVVDPRLAEAEF